MSWFKDLFRKNTKTDTKQIYEQQLAEFYSSINIDETKVGKWFLENASTSIKNLYDKNTGANKSNKIKNYFLTGELSFGDIDNRSCYDKAFARSNINHEEHEYRMHIIGRYYVVSSDEGFKGNDNLYDFFFRYRLDVNSFKTFLDSEDFFAIRNVLHPMKDIRFSNLIQNTLTETGIHTSKGDFLGAAAVSYATGSDVLGGVYYADSFKTTKTSKTTRMDYYMAWIKGINEPVFLLSPMKEIIDMEVEETSKDIANESAKMTEEQIDIFLDAESAYQNGNYSHDEWFKTLTSQQKDAVWAFERLNEKAKKTRNVDLNRQVWTYLGIGKRNIAKSYIKRFSEMIDKEEYKPAS